MSLKTEYGYNEDDFIQNRDGMQELNVTITLCEYRNLIKEVAYQEKTIEKLEEKNNELKKQSKFYQEYIFANHPDLIEKLKGFVNDLINVQTTDHPTEKGGAE